MKLKKPNTILQFYSNNILFLKMVGSHDFMADWMNRKEPQSFEIETEELDPRVQEELEKLNSCTDEINRFRFRAGGPFLHGLDWIGIS